MKRSIGFACLLLAAASCVAGEKPPAITDPAKAGPEFQIQGEYQAVVPDDGVPVKHGVQIIALGNGKFEAVHYVGGLPGDGWDKTEPQRIPGAMKDGAAEFVSGEITGRAADGEIRVVAGNNTVIFKKVERASPTLGAKPPAGAVVLFDGTSADAFQGGRMTDDGLLMEGATSKQRFGSFHLHLEFRTPFMPTARGQGRGNSGVYCQGRYEIQVLDSFGLKGENNECGGIYGVAKPLVNACLPPLSWQTYDIDFTAAQWKNGQKASNARITVRHNGILIHDNVEVPKTTTAAPVGDGPETGPIFLQNHGNPVRFRNIWLVEKN